MFENVQNFQRNVKQQWETETTPFRLCAQIKKVLINLQWITTKVAPVSKMQTKNGKAHGIRHVVQSTEKFRHKDSGDYNVDLLGIICAEAQQGETKCAKNENAIYYVHIVMPTKIKKQKTPWQRNIFSAK